jgi:LAO/AO transport system kinase
VLDAYGTDRIIIETVGVGQSELDIARTADTTIVVLVPESGDAIQMLKAGLMEIADLYVVNKADLPGAEETLRGLRSMVGHSGQEMATWKPPVLRCTATEGDGVAKIADSLDDHWSFLRQDGRLDERRRAIARSEIAYHVNAAVQRRLQAGSRRSADADLIESVAMRRLTAFAAAGRLLDRWEDSERLHR